MKAKSYYYFVLFVLLTGLNVQAQIFQTKADVIEELGTNYESGVTDDGTDYLVYEQEFTTDASGTYTRYKAFYFVELEDGTEVCNMWKISEPSSETNPTVAYFKDKFVEVGYMQWKDYETEIVYDVEVDDGVCLVTAWYDNQK